MAAHADWQVYITANNGDGSNTGITEFQFIDSTGAVISTATATITASSSHGSYPPSNAFDGVVDGWAPWLTASLVFPCSIQAHFTDPVDVFQVKGVAFSSSGGLGQAPRDFSVRYSDDAGSNWTVAKSWTGVTDWSNLVWKTFTLSNASPNAIIKMILNAIKKQQHNLTGGSGGPKLNRGRRWPWIVRQ
jgi:hypothetical protein